MSNLEIKPTPKKAMNTKMLTIAAVLLIILALLFLATPLLRLNRGGIGARGAFNNRTLPNGQTVPGFGTGGNGFQFQGGNGTGNGTRNFPNGFGGGNGTARRIGAFNLLRLNFLSGIAGILIYTSALILSLIAATGMFFAQRWGKILGIIMAVFYLLLGLLSLVPALLTLAFGFRNPLTLILGVLHVLLAIAVIVFASITSKQPAAPVLQSAPPAVTA